LAKWHSIPTHIVHLDIVQQCQNLLLAIFGFIAFDYDLEIFDRNDSMENNELSQALQEFLSTFQMIIYLPRVLSSIYLKLNHRHRRAQTIIERYLCRMIEQELSESPE
ncbi:unnamed protein product, partial [Adineta steineri]